MWAASLAKVTHDLNPGELWCANMDSIPKQSIAQLVQEDKGDYSGSRVPACCHRLLQHSWPHASPADVGLLANACSRVKFLLKILKVETETARIVYSWLKVGRSDD